MSDYHINIFWSDEDGGYIADIPDLEACSAFGATAEEALGEGDEGRSHSVTEAATPEMNTHPDLVVLIQEDIDVVIPGADGSELGPGLVHQIAAVAWGDGRPRRILEEWVIRRRVVREVPPADAEADGVEDLVGDTLSSAGIAECAGAKVGADGGVPACDVEADTNDADTVPVGRHTPDGHDVSEVPVGHEGRTLRAR